MTFTHALATNNYGPAKFIVTSDPANGTHTTIAAALTAASSGDTIFIRPGTYTENLTLKDGVNLTAYGPSIGIIPNVIINGTCTFTAAGTVGLNCICLQTNGSFALAVTGSAASVVVLNNCYLRCTDNTGISLTSSSSSSEIDFVYCTGDLTTTGIALFSHSGAGNLRFIHSNFGNSGSSTTNNTASGSGGFFSNYSGWANGTTISSTATMQGNFLDMVMPNNQTALTYNSTTQGNIQHCTITGNTSSAISIGASASLQVHHCLISSSNSSPITGSGTLIYTDIVFNSISAIDNNVLRSPYPTSQSWTWIQTKVASASATISFTTGLGLGQFGKYMLKWENVIAASGGGQALRLRYDQGAGIVTTGYTGGGVYTNAAAGPTLLSGITTYGILAFALGNAVPASSGSCEIGNALYGASTGATYCTTGANITGAYGFGGFGGTFGNTAAITALEISAASGNIAQGTFSLYGIIT